MKLMSEIERIIYMKEIKGVRDWAKKYATPASTRIEETTKPIRKLAVEPSLF